MNRFLIVKPSSLGDVVHALPTVARLRLHFPQAHIAWLINAELASLLRGSPALNEVIEFERRKSGSWLALLRRLRRGRFDVVVDLQGLLRSGLFTLATGAPRRIGLSDAREGARFAYNETVPVSRAHAVDRYLRVADYLGCPAGPVQYPLALTAAVPARQWIAVSPSARWPTKVWGDDRFAELIRRLPRERVVLTGSADERGRLERLAPGCRNLAGQTSLLELADFYRQCTVLITNDTGPLHLAVAVGTPVIAIFGATDPTLTGPYGAGHIVLRAGIACSPCLKKHCTHRPAMECMSRVTVDAVLTAAKPFLA